jgi:hypothetical protein
MGRSSSAAVLHPHLNLQASARTEVRDVNIRVEDLEVSVRRNVAGLDFPGFRSLQVDRLGVVHVELQRDLLQVHDDICGILRDIRNRSELMENAFNLDGGDRGPFD